MPIVQEKNIRGLFVISLILKGIGSVLEILGGIVFLFTGTLSGIVAFLVRRELVEDPSDRVANWLTHILPFFSAHAHLFGATYLLIHGVIKVFLVVSLLRNKIWAYPATLAALSIFIIYQLYRLAHGYSLFLIVLTFLDILLAILTWHEYKLVKKIMPAKPSTT